MSATPSKNEYVNGCAPVYPRRSCWPLDARGITVRKSMYFEYVECMCGGDVRRTHFTCGQDRTSASSLEVCEVCLRRPCMRDGGFHLSLRGVPPAGSMRDLASDLHCSTPDHVSWHVYARCACVWLTWSLHLRPSRYSTLSSLGC